MNRFVELVGCRIPLQQAGMSGPATAKLAVAVAKTGALGMIGIGRTPRDVVERHLDEIDREGVGVVGCTCIAHFVDRDVVALVCERLPVVEFFWGWPEAARVPAGVICGWQVGSVEEARAAAGAGCHYVIAQGIEAGGHIRGSVPLAELVPAVRAAVDVPVVAAGGIGTAADVRAAIELGADAVRVGTRFVATVESNAHPDYIAALVEATPDDTVLTESFAVGWPDAAHRVLASAIDAAAAAAGDTVGSVRLVDGREAAMVRWGVSTPTRDTTGNIAAMALYAGRSVGGVTALSSAADVVAELAAGLDTG